MTEPGLAEVEQIQTEQTPIRHEVIAEIEENAAKVLDKIISRGIHYDLIIGDDTSGRIPTLILSRVINENYKRKGVTYNCKREIC